MNSIFSEQILADKLSKLNSTQQCIETLSHWCIFHRSKAGLVVKTWDKQFHSSQMVQKVPLLYLANDILQNSKRKGNEFVNEFWMVLPCALKDIIEKGDEHERNVVSRLVKIWEERRVFGSRQKSLRDVMLGEDPPSPLVLTKKRSRTVRIFKRDSRSIKTKLSIGGAAEKIVSAYHLVLSEHQIEDAEMNKCKSAVKRVRRMEKNVDAAFANSKDPSRKSLANALEEEENLLRQCVEKLKSVEANRVALVAKLREALHEQESELENVRTQMQVAEAQVEEAQSIRRSVEDEKYVAKTKRSAADLAAEVADKLTASTSSQMIMSSVLSTFAAEEAKNAANQQQYHQQHILGAQYHLPPPPLSQASYMQQQSTAPAIVNPFGYVNHLQLPHQMHHQSQQQPPAPPSFRPLQPPPTVLYYTHPHHSH